MVIGQVDHFVGVYLVKKNLFTGGGLDVVEVD